ncbi:hypothetical protein SCMC78_48290 [Streptomyces sp. CMC78]|uniref:Uncharacterized protein n=1 Tax=Streptomyces sp. CMC78 TaxID=3231512 RepID=A0AB33KK55_9ACTN
MRFAPTVRPEPSAARDSAPRTISGARGRAFRVLTVREGDVDAEAGCRARAKVWAWGVVAWAWAWAWAWGWSRG